MRKSVSSLIILLLVLSIGGVLCASGIKTKHISHEIDLVRFAYRTNTEELNLKIQVQNTGIDQVFLMGADLEEEYSWLMDFYAQNNFYSFYTFQFRPKTEEFSYYFKIVSGEEVIYYGSNGTQELITNLQPFRIVIDHVQSFSTPDWAKGAVIYQIFPDRFYNGDKTNDPKNGEWDVYGNPIIVQDWEQLPENPPRGADFFGGDLQGIIEKLDYLADLGIQALYLNPIHESVSNHKYDSTDYLKVDDHFGSNDLFRKLVDEAKKRGIYIIIDGVFNHTGSNFWAFQDIIKNGEKSAYKDWYKIYSYPVSPAKGNYASWNNYSSLPVLNYDNREVRDYILQVVRYWLDLGIKGIRLDAPKEVPHAFWQELHQTVKEIDSEVILIGEIWDDASPWINGQEFDSNMNYLYRTSVYNFFIRRTRRASGFAKDLGLDQTRYPEPALHVMYNHLSTHDVERIMTMAGGNIELIKPLTIFHLTYQGSPAIYYGDEIGMEGGRDPDCRRPMIWDSSKQNLELKELYKKLIWIRRESPALQQGSYKTLFTDDQNRVLVFERLLNDERVIVVINNNHQPYTLELPFEQWKVEGILLDLLNEEIYTPGQPYLELKANHGAVLKLIIE